MIMESSVSELTIYDNKEQAENSENNDAKEAEEKEILLSYIAEANERYRLKHELRQNNLNSIKPNDSVTGKLDSSLKKNTAFVRKLRNFTGPQLDSLLKDMAGLNLSMYISEVASAIVDAKLKLTDVPAAVALCSEVHRMYPEFSKVLRESWSKTLALKKDEKISNPSKLRVDLRFYGDLVTSGIFPSKEALPLLGNVLTVLTTMDKEEHNNISIILSFCKYCGEDYAGLVPRTIRCLSDKYQVPVPKSNILPPEKQKNVRSLLKDYYVSLSKHLLKEHAEMQAFERQNKRILQTKGELSTERKEKSEILSANFQKLFNGTQSFSEALDEDFPELPEDRISKNQDIGVGNVLENEDASSVANIWEDEESQHFYQDFPNLKDFLPNLKLPKDHCNQVQSSAMTEETLDQDIDEDLEEDVKKVDESSVNELIEDVEDNENNINASAKIMLDAFFTHLPNCVNREMIDNAAIEFLMNHNTKNHRKKLVKVLFGVPRTRLDLLPFYARLVAILNPVMPEVAIDLGQLLKHDFKYHIRKKDQINIESKIKVIRFIGELVKFQLYSKIEGLYCLKVLLHDFTHHHIEMACNLLETCGRFFFRSNDTHQRTKVYLEQMMRKKAVMALDWRYVTMIENAYYHVNPPEVPTKQVVDEPPLNLFICHILYQELMKPDVESETHVLQLMRKLNWEDQEISRYAINCLTDASKVKYFNIQCLANLLAGLVDYQEFVGAQVVDGVLEDIRLGMEINHKKLNQRRVAMIKYLGELYNYRMVESNDIFKVLYSLISFGVTLSYENPSPIDPPDNLFRLRLVCVLLETCGQFFNHGLSKTKLDYFFIFFQNYFWFKYNDPVWTAENPFPVNVNYMFRDTLLSLRPNLKIATSYEESQKGVIELQKKLFPNVPVLSEKQCVLSGLGTILESVNDEKDVNGNCESEDDRSESCNKTSNENNDNKSGNDNKNKNNEVNLMNNKNLNKSEDGENNKEKVNEDDGGLSIEKSLTEDVDDDGENNNDDTDADDFCDEDDDEDDDDDDEDDDDNRWNDDMDSKLERGSGKRKRQLSRKEVITDEDYDGSDIEDNAKPVLSDEKDDEFVNAFEKMVSDNIQDRMREQVKPQQVDISVPLHFKSNTKKTYEQLQEPEEKNESVNFVLMLRKGNKQQYKSLAVPVDSELAVNLKSQEKAERVEMERVKRLTLDINDRLEEEDYQDQMSQMCFTTNIKGMKPAIVSLNRERRHKYQHPKGAPDADLIFGRKKLQR